MTLLLLISAKIKVHGILGYGLTSFSCGIDLVLISHLSAVYTLILWAHLHSVSKSFVKVNNIKTPPVLEITSVVKGKEMATPW